MTQRELRDVAADIECVRSGLRKLRERQGDASQADEDALGFASVERSLASAAEALGRYITPPADHPDQTTLDEVEGWQS